MTDSEATPSPRKRARNYIAWCFTLSLALHVVGGGYLRDYLDRQVAPAPVVHPNYVTVLHPTPVPPTPAHHPQPHLPPPASKPSRPLTAQHPVLRPTTVAVSSVPPGLGPQTEGTGLNGGPGPGATGDASALPSTPGASPAILSPSPLCSVPTAAAHTLGKPVAEYPEHADGASGETQVSVSLDARGSVTAVEIHKSSGNPYLDQAALATARGATYAPEIRDCERVAGTYLFVADFAAQ